MLNPDTEMNNPPILHVRIRERLDAVGLNPTSAAERAGLNKGAVRDILEGKTSSPRMKTLEAIAEVLGTSVAYLTGQSADPTPGRGGPASPPGTAVIGTAAVGIWKEAPLEEIPEKKIDVPRYDPFPDIPHFAVIAGDRSMQGGRRPINEGDIACCVDFDASQRAITEGSVYLVRRRYGSSDLKEVSLRKAQVTRDRVRFVTEPESGEPDIIEVVRGLDGKGDDSVSVIGLVYAIYYPMES